MSVEYTYRLHGLKLGSELELSGVPETEGEPDVVVRVGAVPDNLDTKVVYEHVLYRIGKGDTILLFERLAGVRFWVRRGKEIIVQMNAGVDPRLMREYLLGAAISTLLYQRGSYILHASAVETTKGALLFVGDSGAGKSTLAAAFQQRGFPLVSDDLAVVSLIGGDPFVNAGSGRLRLWADSLNALGRDASRSEPISHSFKKFNLTFPPLSAEPIRLFGVCGLHSDNISELAVVEKTGWKKLELLERNLYSPRLVDMLTDKRNRFDQSAAVAQRIKVWRVNYLRELRGLGALVESVLTETGLG